MWVKVKLLLGLCSKDHRMNWASHALDWASLGHRDISGSPEGSARGQSGGPASLGSRAADLVHYIVHYIGHYIVHYIVHSIVHSMVHYTVHYMVHYMGVTFWLERSFCASTSRICSGQGAAVSGQR